ncbi:MAG TPA: LacI family DNA-binding transcriptional regulator [Candidatus Angelobacter sp.]|nr:LacI family DNA-binding transcriptional regulator [Candidatus Angelobacter sp.]
MPGEQRQARAGSTPRLRDVAALAKVSVATASRALSGDPRISAPTRRRVERVAARLEYRVNPLARGLSLRRSLTVGLVVGDLTNPFFAELARGVDARLQEAGYASFIADLGGEASRQRELAQRLVDRHVDGLLVTVPHDPEVMGRRDVPVVAIDRYDGVASVSGDNLSGGRLAAEHLLDAGYRRIGLLYADPDVSPVRDRRSGFAGALAAAGRPLQRRLDTRCRSLRYDDAFTCGLELLRRGADAVFAIDDVMAAAVIAAALELGLSVPEDVGVVGYDDTPMAAWRTLSLTSVDQRTEEMGRAAADMLLHRIEHPEAEVTSLTLAPRLVVRGSSTGRSA